ncbi:unnamed protein product [Ceratitis capitata]|uniref:(Mediterranean fruit fly) hypothetical protein n=1 Tax=Ceratitis capitata TaxID=7213 RepID=A0A811V1F5_CERCA|nr:unnamed protein product [Ceratitis capitata]
MVESMGCQIQSALNRSGGNIPVQQHKNKYKNESTKKPRQTKSILLDHQMQAVATCADRGMCVLNSGAVTMRVKEKTCIAVHTRIYIHLYIFICLHLFQL